MLEKFLQEQKHKISNQKRNSVGILKSRDLLRLPLDLDSDGFPRTQSLSRESTISKNLDPEAQLVDQKNQSKMKTQSEIKEMIAKAMKTSMELKAVDPLIMHELRELN